MNECWCKVTQPLKMRALLLQMWGGGLTANKKSARTLSSVILGSSTKAWHICSTPSCTGSMFPSESSISSEWQFTGISKARLASASWTAATPHRMLPVVSDFDLLAATISSYHDIVAARSAVGRSPSPVRWPGMRCLTTSENRRSVPTISGRR